MKRFFQNFFLNFVKITGYIPLWLYLKPHIYYEKKDTPKVSGAEIAVANHTTLLDFVMLMFVYKFKVVRVLMAEVLFKKPLSAWFMRNIRGIKVNRTGDTGVEHMQEMKQTLYDQDVVAIFPEGRLNKQGRDYGELLPISNGALHLAMTTGACIRPMYFHTNGGFFKSSAILVGDPVNIQEKFGSDPTPEALRKARSYLTMRLETLRDDLKLRDTHRYDSLLSRHIRWSMGVLLRCAFGIRFHYTDKAVQAHKLNRNVIIVSNHSSIYDPPMLCTLFPKDRVHIIACETLYKNKWLALLLNRVGSIKIDRTCLDMESFHAINDVLSKGHNVGIFPEGAMFEDGQIHEFKSSFVISALNAGVEVLPVYIGGEYKMFSKKLDIVIDVPMKLEVESLTVEEIEAQAKRVRDRLCYLKETLENRS